jgi:hypothetical protein
MSRGSGYGDTATTTYLVMIPFDQLPFKEKQVYMERAMFLLDRGYAFDVDMLDLAEKLYNEFILKTSDNER